MSINHTESEKVNLADLPIKVGFAHREVSNFAVVRLSDYRLKDPVIAILGDVSIQHESSGLSNSALRVIHPYARDYEGDLCKEISVDLSMLTLKSIHRKEFSFSGWLLEINAYPAGTPLDSAPQTSQKESRDSWGYPYLPPKVEVVGLSLPALVNVTFYARPPSPGEI